MSESLDRLFLAFAVSKLEQFTARIRDCLGRLSDAHIWARAGLAGPKLAERLDATVREAVAVIRALTPERLAERVVIQGYDVTKLEAVLHVLEHFAQHTGQIIYATKLLTGADLGYYRHLDAAAPHADPTP